MMERWGFTVFAYLDDFLIIADTKVECQQPYEELIKLLGELGFQINWDKAVVPCQRLTFLGIEIDTVHRQLTLPEWKLCELRLLLSETTAKQSITKRDLQSLVGKLNFAARVVLGGRTFLWRMIDTVNHMQRHHVRINSSLRADLEWWKQFLGVFNGKAFFIDRSRFPLKNSLPMPLRLAEEDSFQVIGSTLTGPLTILVWRTCTSIFKKRSQFL